MPDMQHSIAAKYAARPAARFVRPSPPLRERRLGLRAGRTFVAASSTRTVLRHREVGPLVALRAPWRTMRQARADRPTTGRPRPVAAMRWTRSVRGGTRPAGIPAPAWRD